MTQLPLPLAAADKTGAVAQPKALVRAGAPFQSLSAPPIEHSREKPPSDSIWGIAAWGWFGRSRGV